MEKKKGFLLWQILYPILIYYVIESVCFFFLGICLDNTEQSYMFRQMICGLVTIPYLYVMFYQKDKKMEQKEQTSEPCNEMRKENSRLKKTVRNILFAVFGSAAFGIAFNNILAMTPLISMSEGYQESHEAFFAGSMWIELLGSGIVIPIAEELLFRGIVYKRLCVWMHSMNAAICSAVLFGIIHMNLVQFIYAGLLGLFFAFLLQNTGNLWIPIVGHMAANWMAILRAETGWLSFSYNLTPQGVGFTCLMLFCAGLILKYMKQNK